MVAIFEISKDLNYNFINDNEKIFTFIIPEEEIEKKLIIMINNILCEKYNKVNKYIFEEYVYRISQNNPKKIEKILYECYLIETQKISKFIEDNCEKKEFINIFLKKYMLYFENSLHIKNLIWYYINGISFNTKKNNKFSYFNLIKSSLFLENVISKQYTYKNLKIDFFPLLLKCINIYINIDELVTILKMQKYYDSILNKFYGNNIIKNINFMKINDLNINNDFIKIIVNNMDNICKKKYEDPDFKIDNIYKYINILSYFNNLHIFEIYYKIALLKRLLINNVDTEFEKLLIKKFANNRVNNIIHKMLCMIEDVEDSRKDKIILDELKIEVNNKSDYVEKDIDIFYTNRYKINPYFLRYNAWNEIVYNKIYYEPKLIKIFISVISKYYKIKYTGRKLYWAHNYGTAITSIILKGKKYSFIVTTPQLFVMALFNEYPQLSGNDISDKTNIPLFLVGKILSTFMEINLITKEEGLNNDPSLKFSINKDFEHQQQNLILASLMISNLQKNNNEEQYIKKNINDYNEDEHNINEDEHNEDEYNEEEHNINEDEHNEDEYNEEEHNINEEEHNINEEEHNINEEEHNINDYNN